MITILAALAAIILQQPPAAPSPAVAKALATQVMLDRTGFSPGPIDGRIGKNTKLALDAFQQSGATETVSPEEAVREAPFPAHGTPPDADSGEPPGP